MSNLTFSKFCEITATGVIGFGSVNIVVNATVAWGTRFVNQISTQACIPAALVGSIHSLTFTIPLMLGRYTDARNESRPLIIIASLLIATFVTITTTPTLATFIGRSISYKEASAFALLNSVTTFVITMLLF